MESITFHCKVITPMFLAGADGQTPELRAPSIKGAMRFWWRALNGHLGVEEMRKREEAIFGGTNTGGRSKVTIRLEEGNIKTGSLPDTKADKEQHPGLQYLWYTIPMNNRPGIWEGNFSVHLSSLESLALEEAALSFWTLANFGGIGTRSRRGGGCFKIDSISGNSSIEFEFVQSGSESLVRHLRRNIDFLANRFAFTRDFNPGSFTPFPMLHNAQIHVLQDSETFALGALERIGRLFKEFRERLQPDYNEVKNYIVSGTFPKQIQRVEFGLPLSFRYTSLDRYGKAGANVKTTKREIDRSASSLIIHINEFNGRYYIVITNFASSLLPEGVDLKLVTPRKNLNQYNQKRPAFLNQPYQGIKESFTSTIRTEIL
ncbi:type III-B CRISPR module RAMP protein Cmr1 [Phaeodactylibacter luteus]|uniref:Type III-B CRISPR module RAMP protein Cmr1 n=1 Tax=Phaeodactylibacter luteus TaxID=1564516 RepID=A0A5C6RQT3_9BACT|nr:type III-B CRISPR module RAMP protein Cmr1 [Phaeodactylibacter luteus]TXB63742.1 type III-B CRISPR module RAMP protein Cmr1 [Phaeodactylibacter luteus]